MAAATTSRGFPNSCVSCELSELLSARKIPSLMTISEQDYKLNHVFALPAFDRSDKQHNILSVIRTRYCLFVSFSLNSLISE